MQSAVHDAVVELIAEQQAAGEHLGVQVAARWRGQLIVDVASGWLDPDRRRPVNANSLFCCFSVSKALAARRLWSLIVDRRLDPKQRVAMYWKGFTAPVTVAEVLTHQAGLHRVPENLDAEFLLDAAAGLSWVAKLLPAWAPGTSSGYHTLTYGWLVRGLYEAVTGEPLPAVIDHDVFFGLPADQAWRAATIVESASARGLSWVGDRAHPAREAMPPAFIPDWNDPRLRATCQPAFSGWSSARALAAHVDAITPAEYELARELYVDGLDRVLELPVRRGLGVELGGRFEGGAVGALGPHERAFGHGGHGGQVVVRDPEAELTIAVLVNLLVDADLAAPRTTTVCELIRGLCDAY